MTTPLPFRRPWPVVTLLGVLMLLSARAPWAWAQPPRPSPRDLLTPEADRAARLGLNHLAQRQLPDGSFGVSGYNRNVGVCALAGLAFLCEGSTPGRGPYGEHIDRCVDYVVEHARQSGYIIAPEGASHGPMYGHGFATMFLAEVHGMTDDARVRPVLSRAARLIVNSQNSEGGWRYHPDRREADISVTVCQVMALRAAKGAGIAVPSETIDSSIEYVKRLQHADGGFMYMSFGGPSEFPRSAAGIAALHSAGVYEGEEIARGLAYLEAQSRREDGNVMRFRHTTNFFYGHYYAAQVAWQTGDEFWLAWFPAIRDELIAHQLPNGSWLDSISVEYGTAMACIILQIPNDALPIFQR